MELADFATAEFALQVKQDDGCSLREHLNNAWEQSGIMPAELAEAPPLPAPGAYLWEYFVDLHNRRANNGFGHVPLTFLEVEAWKSARRRSLDDWELDAILDIDTAYIASIAKKAEGPS